MPLSNPMDILLEHDHWASRQMGLACEMLTAEQFDQPFDIGPGSLRKTLTHIISATHAWSDTLAQRTHRLRLDQQATALPAVELTRLLDDSTREFAELARSHPLEQIVIRIREGKEYRMTRGAVVTHTTTHAMHHRAQCLNMLRRLGVHPLPLSSVLEWVRTVDAPQ